MNVGLATHVISQHKNWPTTTKQKQNQKQFTHSSKQAGLKNQLKQTNNSMVDNTAVM